MLVLVSERREVSSKGAAVQNVLGRNAHSLGYDDASALSHAQEPNAPFSVQEIESYVPDPDVCADLPHMRASDSSL